MGGRNEAAIALYETLGFRTDLSWSLGGKVPLRASWMQRFAVRGVEITEI